MQILQKRNHKSPSFTATNIVLLKITTRSRLITAPKKMKGCS